MGYATVFGGNLVKPSTNTYLQLALSANASMAWPIEAALNANVISDVVDVTPSAGGLTITLPDATGGGQGTTMLLNNLSGSFSFSVLNAGGATVATIAAGTVWAIYLADNSTANGTWRAYQFGAQAGSVNVAAIAGSGLLAVSTSLNQSMPVSTKNSNYTVVNSDRSSVLLWIGAAGTFTLPTAATVGSNWFVNIRNSGTGDLSVAPPSGTIDGVASKTFTAGVGSAIVFTDGANYYTVGYGSSGSAGGFDYTTINAAGSGDLTLAGAQLNRISYLLTGALTGNRNIIVPSTVQQYWINNQTTGAFTLTVKTAAGTGQTVAQGQQAIMYCDGTNVIAGQSGVTTPIPVASGGTGATTASAARTNLGSSATGDALFTAASAAAARTTLGSTTVGDAVFVAASQAAAQSAIGSPSTSGSGASGTWAISISGSAASVANALTINNSGAGAVSGSTYNGSGALTISYNTVGAPSTTGTNATGTWSISINGNAATATTATTATTANATAGTLTINNGGAGGGSGSTFNGSGNVTISYNTIGAPSTTGSGASGTWGINITGSAPAGSLTGTINAAQMPAHTGDVTSSAGSVALTIASGAVTASKVSGGVLRQGSLGSGVITVQSGGTASGGSDGDIFLIY